MRRISELFEDAPEQWGLRGDPFLWEEMKEHLGARPVPEAPDDLELILHSAFVELTHGTLDAITPIRVEDMIVVARQRHGFTGILERNGDPAYCLPSRLLTGRANHRKVSAKMLGDAGEHYALSQFTLAGFPASKMPENWEGYDLAVESGKGLLRVSAQTKEWPQMEKGNWFVFDDRKHCDWIVFIFVDLDNSIRAWVVPFEVAKSNANKPGPQRKDPWIRDISFKKLNGKSQGL